jgi:hypothetical protein
MANTTNIQKLIPFFLILGLETVDSKFFIGQLLGYDMSSKAITFGTAELNVELLLYLISSQIGQE